MKERLFGLTGSEGNHGEDVKELYYYLDSTPTHSYMKGLYKYPFDEYPYEKLVKGNQSRRFVVLLVKPQYASSTNGLSFAAAEIPNLRFLTRISSKGTDTTM